MEKQQFFVWYFLVAFLLILAMQNFLFAPHAENLAYSEFNALLNAGKIEDVAIGERVITGTFKPEGLEGLLPKEKLEELKRADEGKEHRFVTVRVSDPDLVKDLDAAKVRYAGVVESKWFSTLLSWIVPAVIFFAQWGVLMKRMGGGTGGFLEIGKSKAKVYMFQQARTKAPAIIFIDELDALGRARGAYPLAGGHDEKEQTLNQLLSEMDGFDPSAGLILLAATNRPEILDPALLRAGRFDRQVLVDRPDRLGRVAILKVHMKKARLAPDADPEAIAALTPGFTGADLANLVNEAALLATRRGAEAVAMDDFTRAIERIVAGLEKKNRLLNPREREVVAYHEMGHALVALSLPGTDPVHKVSIIPRGIGALGYTIQRPTEDRYLMTREELENKMAVLLGGRAAERLVFEHFSTGAADDLAKVTDIARAMVMRYGMHEKLGHVAYETEHPAFLQVPGAMPATREYSEDTADEIDLAVRDIAQAAFDRAVGILKEQRETLERGACELLARETLGEEDLNRLRAAATGVQATPTQSGGR